MAKVIKLPIQSPGKFDLKRVQKLKKSKKDGQLNLFSVSKKTKVIDIGQQSGFFESAMKAHDQVSEEAKAMYHKAIEMDDHAADAYCNLGILESEAGHTSTAIDCFTKSLERAPRHFESHYNLANLYADAGNSKLAILHYEVARELSPEDASIHYNLALVLALEGKYALALDALNTYFQYHLEEPTDKEALKLLAMLRSSTEKAN